MNFHREILENNVFNIIIHVSIKHNDSKNEHYIIILHFNRNIPVPECITYVKPW